MTAMAELNAMLLCMVPPHECRPHVVQAAGQQLVIRPKLGAMSTTLTLDSSFPSSPALPSLSLPENSCPPLPLGNNLTTTNLNDLLPSKERTLWVPCGTCRVCATRFDKGHLYFLAYQQIGRQASKFGLLCRICNSRWRANSKDGARQQAKKVICKLKQTKHGVIVIVRTMSRVMHVMLSMLRPTTGPL